MSDRNHYERYLEYNSNLSPRQFTLQQQLIGFRNHILYLKDTGNVNEIARLGSILDHSKTSGMLFHDWDDSRRGANGAHKDPERAAVAMDFWRRSTASEGASGTSDYDPYMHISLSEEGPDYHLPLSSKRRD
jgi:hypothetical protein